MTTKDIIRNLERVRANISGILSTMWHTCDFAELREREDALTHAITILRRLDDSMPDKRASNAAQTAVKPVKRRQKAK